MRKQKFIRTVFKLRWLNGLKQYPIDLDFHITPVITLGRADKREVGDLGSACGVFIEWGHWGAGIAMYRVKIY